MSDTISAILDRIFAREADLRAARALVRELEQKNLDDIECLKQEVKK